MYAPTISMMALQSFFLLILTALAAVHGSPVRLIIDTDMSTDCDDVAAVCIANQLHQQGEVDLLAVMHNTGIEQGIGAVSVLNTFYNHSHIALGAYMGEFGQNRTGVYVADLVEHWPSTIQNRSQVKPAWQVYREVLSQQPNNSVTIASIGFTTNMELLLKTPGDDISPLTGTELVQAKVAGVAWMGGKYPSSAATGPEWNFGGDGIGSSTAYTVDHWPKTSEITFLGWYAGHLVRVCKRREGQGAWIWSRVTVSSAGATQRELIVSMCLNLDQRSGKRMSRWCV
eukprot:TRINITY_DN8526_c0_g1_i2.p2 TRINITY_DN8526_c0_g1~~TRINITY_DN8526_c0_g1_i2.p2  ORF type:complete len:285 (+),score=19.87 TRINITY_DN8526_c0_g1_i2:1703-2557(+)